MKNFARITFILLGLLLFASVASASHPGLPAFSTTGQITIPPEYAFLPSGNIKFHIFAEGDVTGGLNGTFNFEEWGLVFNSAINAGVNYGDMTVNTDDGPIIDVRFSGQSEYGGVKGSFLAEGEEEKHKEMEGKGTYEGTAGYVFTVDYTPCEGKDCLAANSCALFGKELKLKKKDAKWEIKNEGQDLTLSNVTIDWPVGNGALKKVKWGGKQLNDEPLLGMPAPLPVSPTLVAGGISLSDWSGKDKDLRLRHGEKKELKLEFENKDISSAPSDYSILVQFDNDCAAAFVAFD